MLETYTLIFSLLLYTKASLEDTPNVGNLVALAKTLDQAKAVLSFLDAVSEKTLR
jgi:N-acetyltransferase 10